MGSKPTAFLVACCFVLFSFDMSGSDLGLPDPVTTKRLALLLLTFTFLLRKPSQWKSSPQVMMVFCVVMATAVWALMSGLVNDLSMSKTALAFTKWALIAYAILLLNEILPEVIDKEKQSFCEFIALIGSAVTLLAILWLYKSEGVGVFISRFALRDAIDNLSTDNSRFMNGLFMCNIIPLSIALGVMRARPLVSAVSMTGAGMFLFLALREGSRQTVGGTVLFIMVLLVLTLYAAPQSTSMLDRSRRRIYFRLAIGITLLAVFLLKTFLSADSRYELYQAFVERTAVHIDGGGQGRQQVALDAFRTACANPFFGVGDFVSANQTWNTWQMYTDNGYANVMANFGFVPLAVLLGLFFLCLIWGFRHRHETASNWDLWLVTYSIVVVYLGWSVFLNDILEDYMLFFLLSLMMLSICRVNRASLIEESGRRPAICEDATP